MQSWRFTLRGCESFSGHGGKIAYARRIVIACGG
jgi:hypothetical protein